MAIGKRKRRNRPGNRKRRAFDHLPINWWNMPNGEVIEVNGQQFVRLGNRLGVVRDQKRLTPSADPA